MKRILCYMALGLLISSVITSCKKEVSGSGQFITEDRTVTSFTGVENDGDFKVLIQTIAAPSLVIHGEDNIVPEIETHVENGILKLRYKARNMNYNHKGVVISIGMPVIDMVDVHGNGSIESNGPWKVTELLANVNGSGYIRLDANATRIKAVIAGSGFINMQGKSDKTDFNINGSGNIHAYDLLTNDAVANIAGSGSVETSAVKTLDATINGSGKVYYRGDPIVTTHINGSGKVIKQ